MKKESPGYSGREQFAKRTTGPFKDAEDKLLFAKVLDKYTAAAKNHRSTHTDFLDAARCANFMQVLTKHGATILPKLSESRENIAEPGAVSIFAYGGYENAERKMIIFNSDDISATTPIVPITVTYNEKFSKSPTHRDYLGAVLGLGLDRGKIGDIRLANEGAVLYAVEDVAHFIAENLYQVGRVSVKAKIQPISVTNKLNFESTDTTKRITVPSMRLDAVLGAAFNLSRGKAAALIDAEKVFVNWKPVKKTYTVVPGETITVRGMGRATIDSQGGNTKKDRIVLEVVVHK